MNIIEVQDSLKNYTDDSLSNEMQSPSGSVPQYLVLSELMRRKKMRQAYQAREAGGEQPTVKEEMLAGAGVPASALGQMGAAMAPKTDLQMNTGVTPTPGMAEGGMVYSMGAEDMPIALQLGLFPNMYDSQPTASPDYLNAYIDGRPRPPRYQGAPDPYTGGESIVPPMAFEDSVGGVTSRGAGAGDRGYYDYMTSGTFQNDQPVPAPAGGGGIMDMMTPEQRAYFDSASPEDQAAIVSTGAPLATSERTTMDQSSAFEGSNQYRFQPWDQGDVPEEAVVSLSDTDAANGRLSFGLPPMQGYDTVEDLAFSLEGEVDANDLPLSMGDGSTLEADGTVAPGPPPAAASGSGGGSARGSLTGASSPNFSAAMQKLQERMGERDVNERKLKALSLARLGAGLMAGTSGNFGIDMGNASNAALDQLDKGLGALDAREQGLQDNEIQMMMAQEQARAAAANAALNRAAAASKATGLKPADILKGYSEIEKIDSTINAYSRMLDENSEENLLGTVTPLTPERREQIEMSIGELQDRQRAIADVVQIPLATVR